MRIVLGIDTSTRYLNTALLAADGRVLASSQEEVPTHTTRLVPAVDELLKGAGALRSELAAVGAVVGPGSFTGLRVGLSAAQGLSLALGIPAFGLDSLTALACSCDAEGEGLALLDARRAQVYARRFTRSGGGVRAAGDPLALAPSDVLAGGYRPAWAAGDGVPLVEGWLPSVRLFPGIPNLAIPAARRAFQALAAGAPPEEFAPLYVRGPDVREPKK
jgi:tRNA threonylcarbamoyladenosine biosynthesis protein TsaB